MVSARKSGAHGNNRILQKQFLKGTAFYSVPGGIILKYVNTIHDFLWGAPVLILLLGVGIYLTVISGIPQITLFGHAFRKLFQTKSNPESGSITPFQALCTALAATVGTGNLVGVAGAICLGGPGAVFWMWICGIVGMATKYAEVTLAVRYRIKRGTEYLGGPMYMISQGMGKKWRWIGSVYSILGILASFGIGNAIQINSVISGMHSVMHHFGIPKFRLTDLLIGIILAVFIGQILQGGTKRVGKFTEKYVPLVSGGYILLCLFFLISRAAYLPAAFRSIMVGAFHPGAVTGGILGSAFRSMSVGSARGVFSNEAGMGTAAMAHASAQVSHPAEQGMLGILEVFFDTLLICTLTAMVILCSGVSVQYGTDAGMSLTTDAFCSVFGSWVSVVLTGAVCLFAFSTILGWGLHGAKCCEFLLGRSFWKPFVLFQAAAIVLGAFMNTQSIWMIAEIFNGLMAIPTLITLIVLSPELRRLSLEYKMIRLTSAM